MSLFECGWSNDAGDYGGEAEVGDRVVVGDFDFGVIYTRAQAAARRENRSDLTRTQVTQFNRAMRADASEETPPTIPVGDRTFWMRPYTPVRRRAVAVPA